MSAEGASKTIIQSTTSIFESKNILRSTSSVQFLGQTFPVCVSTKNWLLSGSDTNWKRPPVSFVLDAVNNKQTQYRIVETTILPPKIFALSTSMINLFKFFIIAPFHVPLTQRTPHDGKIVIFHESIRQSCLKFTPPFTKSLGGKQGNWVMNGFLVFNLIFKITYPNSR